MLLTGIYCIANINDEWLLWDKYYSVHDDKDRKMLLIFSLCNMLSCQTNLVQSLVWVPILSLGTPMTLAKLLNFPVSQFLSLSNVNIFFH